MSKPVLFVTGLGKLPERSENINAIYQAYPGEKEFISTHDADFRYQVQSGKYDLMVIDIFPVVSPGKTIMIWHSIQGGKYIGLDDRNTYYREKFAKYMDRIVVAGHGGVDMFHQCTAVPKERIVNLGMPRTDRYIGKQKGDGHTGFADKRVYLFAPTFRSVSDTPYPMIDWEWLDNQLTDDEVMVVKAHPYGFPAYISGLKHIVEVDRYQPSVNYLYDCDVVITDYSSIIFDGYLLNKPSVLFEKVRGYTGTRGMYLKYPDQYSSRYARDEEELLSLVRSAEAMNQTEVDCMNYVADMCDGHSCERICKLIDEMNRGEGQ